MSETKGMDRRRFLKNSALGVGAVTIGPGLANSGLLQAEEKSQSLKIKEYRTLGRTGFKVSDISTGFVKDPAVLEALLDAGVNYIDTAESYGNEPTVGEVVSKRDRKKVFITTKLEIKEKAANTKEEFLSRAYKCLERLKTDYVDCIMNHSPEQAELVTHENFHAAMKQLKAEGKLKHVGISHHGTNWYRDPKESMEKVLTKAAMDGRYDVMLLAYNFVQDDNGAKVLKLLKEKNIGATLMKVNPIGNIFVIKERIKKLKEEGKEIPKRYPGIIARIEAKADRASQFIETYGLKDAKRMRDAAIRFVLSNPDVNTVCCMFSNFDNLDDFLPLSGTRLSGLEKKKLAAYKEGCAQLYCRHACGLCEPACPNNVPVNTIMRYNHYFEAQGKEKFAMKHYARLDTPKADVCANCSTHQCESACPYGVPAQGLLTIAHNTLSLV